MLWSRREGKQNTQEQRRALFLLNCREQVSGRLREHQESKKIHRHLGSGLDCFT